MSEESKPSFAEGWLKKYADGLRFWFFIHFVVDVGFAVPLLTDVI